MSEIDNREKIGKEILIEQLLIYLKGLNNTCIVKANTVQRTIIRIDFHNLLLLYCFYPSLLVVGLWLLSSINVNLIKHHKQFLLDVIYIGKIKDLV